MSKPVKNLIAESYKRRFDGLTGAAIIDIRGIESNDNNRLRTDLGKKQIRVTVVKNTLAQRVFNDTDLAGINALLDGPSALVYSAAEETSVVSIARELIPLVKEIGALEFKGALMDGIVFSADELEALSKYPTKPEAQAQVVQILLTPAQKLVGSILSPGQKVAGLVDAIKEKLEKGEAIQAA